MKLICKVRVLVAFLLISSTGVFGFNFPAFKLFNLRPASQSGGFLFGCKNVQTKSSFCLNLAKKLYGGFVGGFKRRFYAQTFLGGVLVAPYIMYKLRGFARNNILHVDDCQDENVDLPWPPKPTPEWDLQELLKKSYN